MDIKLRNIFYVQTLKSLSENGQDNSKHQLQQKIPQTSMDQRIIKKRFLGFSPPASIVTVGPVASFLPCLIKLSTPFSHLD